MNVRAGMLMSVDKIVIRIQLNLIQDAKFCAKYTGIEIKAVLSEI